MKRIMLAVIITFTAATAAFAQAGGLIRTGATLYWQASTGDFGVMRVGVVSGQYFELSQTNERNKAAGVQKLYGAILDMGQKIVIMNVGNWKEVWEGEASSNRASGDITAGSSKYTFTISKSRLSPLPSESSEFSESLTAPFIIGKTLVWSSNAMNGQAGTMRVVSVKGDKFIVEQRNDNNRAAGVIRMDGEVKGRKFFLYNRQWNETWIGTLINGVVTGKINNNYRFQISE